MPGFLYLLGTRASCPHQAPVAAVTSNNRVFVGVAKQPVLTVADQFTVGGCPFQIPFGVGTKPQPCVTVKWSAPSTRIKINGQPALLTSSQGMALTVEQLPQGSVIVTSTTTPVAGA